MGNQVSTKVIEKNGDTLAGSRKRKKKKKKDRTVVGYTALVDTKGDPYKGKRNCNGKVGGYQNYRGGW